MASPSYPISLPSTFPVTSAEFGFNSANIVTESPTSGSMKSAKHTMERWEARIELRDLQASEARDWRAFFAKIRGTYGSFKMGDPAYDGPNGTMAGSGKIMPVANVPFINFLDQGDWVNVKDDSSLDVDTTFSIEAWIRLEKTGSTQIIMQKGFESSEVGRAGWQFGVDQNDKLFFEKIDVSNIDRKVTGSTSLSKGVWNHVAVTVDTNDTSTLYLNGSKENDSLTGVTGTNDKDLRLGIREDNTAQFEGDMDDIRLWNDVRTQTEIQNNFKNTLDGSESNLVAYWDLASGSGTSITDRTSNSNKGTFNGDVSWVLQTNNEVMTYGWDANESNLIKKADQIEIEKRLKLVYEDVSSDSEGIARIKFKPDPGENFSDDATIVTSNPKGEFKMKKNPKKWEESPPFIHGFSFEAVEVL